MADFRWSYRTRCGDEMAANLLRDMLPMTATAASKIGLVDLVLSRDDNNLIPPFHGPDLGLEEKIFMSLSPEVALKCAPWCYRRAHDPTEIPPTIMETAANKVAYFARNRADFSLPALVHFRYEELSQMLLDCHHPQRSQRYHTRRRAFIRKAKCGKTPSRYAPAIKGLIKDEEHSIHFDAVGDWVRGSEWDKFLSEFKPPMLKFSAWTRVILFPREEEILGRPDGYRYEGPLTNFERMLQRVALCCSADLSLDFQALLNRLVAVTAPDPRAHTIVPDKPAITWSHTWDNWVKPQLHRIRQRITLMDQQREDVETAVAEQADSRDDEAPSYIAPNAMSRLELPTVRSSSTIVDMSTAPSNDTRIDTPPRLPFSRSASPVPGESDHLGSTMLQAMVESSFVEPPKPQSRRYSRLNTGDPDLLIRAAGPSGRVSQPTR